MRVKQIMRSKPVTIPVTADLRTAARELLERPIDTVTIVDEGEQVGLLTERAVVKAAVLSNEPLGRIPVEKVMDQTAGSVPPSMPVRGAVERMNRQRLSAIAVADGLEVVGSLSARDIKRNYPQLMQQAKHKTEELEETWNSEDKRIEFDN